MSNSTVRTVELGVRQCLYSEGQIKESGLLSPERMAEVSAAINTRIVPCCDASGAAIKNAFIADHGGEGRFVYARCDSDHMVEYMRRSCLPAVLTPTELDVINDKCHEAREDALNKERFAKAAKVEAWDGGVWLGDQYFSSMDELCDHLESHGEEWPEYVWPAAPQTVIGKLDVADVVENQISDRGWEDMETSDLNGVVELQAALDKFVEANAAVKSYRPDHKVVILMAAWKEAAARNDGPQA